MNDLGVIAKSYEIGDMIAVLVKKNKAISCKVVTKGLDKGQGQTKNGSIIDFEDDQVLWRLGLNKKWPKFVHRAFRGECEFSDDSDRKEVDTIGSKEVGRQ